MSHGRATIEQRWFFAACCCSQLRRFAARSLVRTRADGVIQETNSDRPVAEVARHKVTPLGCSRTIFCDRRTSSVVRKRCSLTSIPRGSE